MTSVKQVVRDENAGDLVDMTLIFAVATILGIRAFLALTGYPQLGGGGLHIAHTLWGGLGMLVSIGLLLSFWSPAIRQLAAALGGIGFGFFIDELGKFITTDVDYFFQPTIALLYVLFIILFLASRVVGSRQLTAVEIGINRQINAAMTGEGHVTPIVQLYEQIVGRLQDLYVKVVSRRWFAPFLSAAFIAIAVTQIVTIVALVAAHGADSAASRHLPLLEQGASAVSSMAIIAGVIRLRASRLQAYRCFRFGSLVSILVTQVFMFYYSELAALGGLIGHVLVFYALRFLIARELEANAVTGGGRG